MVARLAGRFAGSRPLLLAAWLSVLFSTLLATWAAGVVAPMIPARAKVLMVVLALVFAAGEIAWRRRPERALPAPLQEPTRSFSATFIVLAMGQIADAPRFLVFALAMATGAPELAALGGVLAGGVALTLAWAFGESALARPLITRLQWVAASVFLLAAIITGLSEYGLL